MILNNREQKLVEENRFQLYTISILLIVLLLSSIASFVAIDCFHQSLQAQNIPTSIPSASSKSGNMSVYQNSTYGIRIQYPSDWLYREHDRTNIVTFIPPSAINSILKLLGGNMGKQLTNSTSISPFVTIGLRVLPFYNLPLSLFNNLTINSLKALPSFHLLQFTQITLGGSPASLIVYSQGPTITASIYTIIGNKAYIVAYVANPTLYPKYIAQVRNMINSLAINSTACTFNLC